MANDHEIRIRLETLNEIGQALSSVRDFDRLMERIAEAARAFTQADGVTFYRIHENRLAFDLLRNLSLGLYKGGSAGEPVDLPEIPLHHGDGSPNHSLVVAHAALTGNTVNVRDVYSEPGFDFSGTRAFDARTGYRSQSFLTVPMKDHVGEVIGVLQLINAGGPHPSVRDFTDADQELVESLASQASIALSNRRLLEQMAELFESLIKLINTALDEKSPYTGGHCERVPELTMMLAEAAASIEEGPLADFTMTEADRYELKIAGLLHDCGKITTPVHVVDKATKLQTLYDRIGLVDTRFEVLKRDAELAALRRQLALRPVADAAAEAQAQQALQQELAALDADRDFLRKANIGGEAMSAADQQRVRDVGAQRQWRNPQGLQTSFLTAEEVENLTIRSGTLTQAERDIINHHIVATNKMLETLPWPRHLKNVPEYAGGHHERMDGRGYPKGLTRDQMSVQARMMGIADVFEALTAADRPYKSGMSLSQALGIMAKMRDGGHIDPDLFDVFVDRQVYRRYAQAFLTPEQNDC